MLSSLRSEGTDSSGPEEESILILSNCASFFSKAAVSPGKSNRCALLRVCYLVYRLSTETGDEVRAGWHRMFAAAVTCFGNAESASRESQEPCSQRKHTEICNVAFAFLEEIHDDDDGHDEPSETDIRDRVSKSQVPNEMINVLRHCVCDTHSVDFWTEKTFCRIKHLQDLDRTASREGVQAGPSSKTGESESQPKPTTLAGPPEGPDAPADSPGPHHSATDIPPPDLQALSDPAGAAGAETKDHDRTRGTRDPSSTITTDESLPLPLAHVEVTDVDPVSDIGALSNPRGHQGDESLQSDVLERLSPQSESVAGTYELRTGQIGRASSHVHEDKGDEAGDASSEEAAGSSVDAEVYP
ncbi:hypothetical protein EIP86_006578 [Pleurotus ostreatoroseus]|nr:hypothetical protein EIP86_006578 [Pleurotus ostreatoroseus]